MPTPEIDALDSLAFYRYRVDITLERPLAVPAQQRSVLWRGAFGMVFRKLVCHDMDLACEACPLRLACPFPRVFAPSIPEGRLAIGRLRDPPRPFVFADPNPESPSLPTTPVALGLTLVGAAAEQLPYFVVSLRRLGDDGVGHQRNRFRVDSVRCVDAVGVARDVVCERGSEIVRPSRVALRARDLMRPGDAGCSRVRVRYVTPTDVRGGSVEEGDPRAAQAPSFGALVRRARDRVGALATFFGDGPLGSDPRAVGAAAEGVKTTDSEVTRAGVVRRSARTGQRHVVSGVVGAAIYEGAGIGELMPWLRLAEALGVGKHATFGNGRIAVEALG